MTSPSGGHPGLSPRSFALRCVLHFLLVAWMLAVPGTLESASASPQPAPSDKSREKAYALIFGTVWGPDDRPVYGIPIKIRRSNEHKNRWELVSDHSGEFAQRVPAGKQDYIVTADLKGLKSVDGKPLQAEQVSVHVDYDERADISLHLK